VFALFEEKGELGMRAKKLKRILPATGPKSTSRQGAASYSSAGSRRTERGKRRGGEKEPPHELDKCS